MPDIDGTTATLEIRKMIPQNDHPYIIALTANAQHDIEQQCLNNGFNAFLPKPFKLEALDAVIRQSLPMKQ
jgi:two-component system sensor histidine kinase/response regulator